VTTPPPTPPPTIELAPPSATGHVVHAGRRIGWTAWGDQSGQPVLFVHGAALTGALGPAADAVAGARWISVDRAGLGRSQPDPGKDIASVADDTLAMLAALGIARPPAIGFSQGAPFAVELAGRGALSALAIVSGQDDLTYPATFDRLAPDVAQLVGSAAADAVELEDQLTGIADAAGLWTLIVDGSGERDRAVYQQPAFAAALRAALDDGFAQGNAGYARDLVLALGTWPTRPEAVTIPVHLWYGLLDASTTHSPDAGATLALRFPKAVRHALADEGGSLLWTRGAEIVAALLAAPPEPASDGSVPVLAQ
jgi:pimeloyl-ACP methyl ester carboxylesterase